MKDNILEFLTTIGFFIFLYFLATLESGCGPTKIIKEDDKLIDAGTIEDCKSACDIMENFKYPGWRGSPGKDNKFGTEDDPGCVASCEDVFNQGSHIGQGCIKNAGSYLEINNCFI